MVETDGFWVGSLVHIKRDLTGNLYMRNRCYDAQAGRFTQEDPIGLAGGLNAYGFANGDPVSYSDPYGLCKRPGGTGIGICLEAFIAGPYFGFGDHRGPSAHGGTYKAHIGFSVDPLTGELSGVSKHIGDTKGVQGSGWLDVSVQANPEGGWIVTMRGSAQNGEGIGPWIDFDVDLNVSLNGQVSPAAGSHDGFPSYEIWIYEEGKNPVQTYNWSQGGRWNFLRLIDPMEVQVAPQNE